MKNIFYTIVLIFYLSNLCKAQQIKTIEIQLNELGEKLYNYTLVDSIINQKYTPNNNGITTINTPKNDLHLIVQTINDYKESFYIRLSDSLRQKITLSLSNSIHTLDPVTLSGNFHPTTRSNAIIPTEVYNNRFFEKNPNPSFFESLQNINGVRPQLNCNICNTGDIHINGMEGPYTMILIDGMPIVSGLGSVYGLSGIPQSMIDRIEIIKGPSSTLYGSEAVGGLINIITKKAKKRDEFHLNYFSTSWLEHNIDVGTILTKKESAVLIGLNYFNYQNPVDNNNDNFTDIAQQHRFSGFIKLTSTIKKTPLNIGFRYVTEDRWGGELNWNKSFRGTDSIYGESIYTNRYEIIGSYRIPLKTNLELQWSLNNHNQNSAYGTTWYIANQNIAFGQIIWRNAFKDKHLNTTGLTLRHTTYDDNTVATALQKDITILPGIYTQQEYLFSEKNRSLLGIRYDYNSNYGAIFSPRISHKINNKSKSDIIRISIGNGYRIANVFTEDHAALTGARTVVFANELKPEKSWNYTINYNKIITKQNYLFNIDLSLFYTNFNNKIIPDYITNSNQIIYDNLEEKAISQGISISLDIFSPKRIEAKLGQTIMDVSIIEKGKKQRQLLTERSSSTWTLSYKLLKHKIRIDYTGNLYGPMALPLLNELDNRPAYSPIWSIQNIQISKKTKKLTIYGGVKNLLNYTPPSYSIARPFDPFDKNVSFDNEGNPISTQNNPNALTFDPSYMFAPNQGIRLFWGLKFDIR